ncbi:MAG TPA: 50S ribosomal protein L11 methyltransferase [Anaerolineales bacterium]|nr:50S ribosomal protein L11 methyltransferase [Anaerolineales bacterium]
MKKQAWLEVSLTVNGELAEAVAEVLARFAPGGVVIESTAIEAAPYEFGEPVGPMRVCGYLPVDDQLEDARQRLTESLWYLGRIQPLPEPQFATIQETNWMAAWKTNYRPIEIGENLLILPAWVDVPDTARVWLKIDPGMAFGTGTHPTTQLSLMLLEKYLRLGDTVLDIGCGSGILSVAARKLGAVQAAGVDIDPNAVEIARQTAEANHVLENIHFEAGSVEDVRDGLLPLRQAPVVVANILTHILVRLLDDGMATLVAPGGVLLLSGILEEKEGEITAALGKHGMKIVDKLMIEDWVGLAARAA